MLVEQCIPNSLTVVSFSSQLFKTHKEFGSTVVRDFMLLVLEIPPEGIYNRLLWDGCEHFPPVKDVDQC